jgi:hypothetical protein
MVTFKMTHSPKVMTSAVIFLLFIPSLLLAAPILKLTEDTTRYPLGKYLDILEDKESKWTVEDMSSPAIAGGFVPVKVESQNLGWTKSAIWLRFQVASALHADRPMILQLGDPRITEIDLYIPDGKGGHHVKKTGRLYPYSQREIENRSFLFKITVPAHSDGVFYLRLWAPRAMMAFSLTLSDTEAFFADDQKELFMLGILYGSFFLVNLFGFL